MRLGTVAGPDLEGSWAAVVRHGIQGVVGVRGRTGVPSATRVWPGIAKLLESEEAKLKRADGEAEALEAGASPRPWSSLGLLSVAPSLQPPMAHHPLPTAQ